MEKQRITKREILEVELAGLEGALHTIEDCIIYKVEGAEADYWNGVCDKLEDKIKELEKEIEENVEAD